MTDPGLLSARLVLEAPIETADGAGGVARSHMDIAVLWAEIVPVAARERVTADRALAAVTHRIRIRHRDDLTTKHRLRLGARHFRIVALRDAERNRRFLLVEAEELRG